MKISIAEVKRKLSEGTEYTGEFVGLQRNDVRVTRRRVKSQKSQMVSEFLDGPNVGQVIYHNWKNTAADERDGSIFLTATETGVEFLKVTIHPKG